MKVKDVDIRLEITSKDKNKVVGDVSLKDPETGKPLYFSGVEFVRISDGEVDNIGAWWAEEYPETKGGWAMDCHDNLDNYDLYYDIIMLLVLGDYVKGIEVLTKLVKRGSISLPNPFFTK